GSRSLFRWALACKIHDKRGLIYSAALLCNIACGLAACGLPFRNKPYTGWCIASCFWTSPGNMHCFYPLDITPVELGFWFRLVLGLPNPYTTTRTDVAFRSRDPIPYNERSMVMILL
ncbi:unnamed protein product, partial [Pylaiella littoralis]